MYQIIVIFVIDVELFHTIDLLIMYLIMMYMKMGMLKVKIIMRLRLDGLVSYGLL